MYFLILRLIPVTFTMGHKLDLIHWWLSFHPSDNTGYFHRHIFKNISLILPTLLATVSWFSIFHQCSVFFHFLLHFTPDFAVLLCPPLHPMAFCLTLTSEISQHESLGHFWWKKYHTHSKRVIEPSRANGWTLRLPISFPILASFLLWLALQSTGEQGKS